MTPRARIVPRATPPRIVRPGPDGLGATLATLLADVAELRGGSLTLDLRDVTRIGTDELQTLGEVIRTATSREVDVRCAAVAPSVYKAMHLAKLATLVTRVPDRAADEGDAP